MVLIDHVMVYLMEGGEPLELTPDAATLGLTRLVDILLIFFIATVDVPRKKLLL